MSIPRNAVILSLLTVLAPLLGLAGAPHAAPAGERAAPARPAPPGPNFPYRVPESWARNGPLIIHADSLRAARRTAAEAAYLDSLILAGRARDDRDLLIQALIRRGGGFAFRGQVAQGEPDLLEAFALSSARRDTLGMIKSLQWRAFAYNRRMRFDVSLPLWDRMLAYARATGEPSHEGWALMGLAYAHAQKGQRQRALSEYRACLACMQRAGDGPGMLLGRSSYAELARDMGRIDEARGAYIALVRDAHEANQPYTESIALHNLGSIEFSNGDPAQSVEYWRRAQTIQDALGIEQSAPGPAYALAIALTNLARLDEAAEVLEPIRRRTLEQHNLDGWARTQTQLGIVRRLQGRLEESERLLRAVLVHSDSLSADGVIAAEAHLANVLQAQGRWADALAVLAPRASAVDPVGRNAEHLRARAQILVTMRRPREALALVGPPPRVRAAKPTAEATIDLAAAVRARAYLLLGEPDSALTALRGALQGWETRRSRASTFDWREATGRNSSTLPMLLAAAMLSAPSLGDRAARARLTFDALQQFKARTLEERVRGPAALDTTGRTRVAHVTLERLQRSVLHDGELLLDYHVGRDSSLVFAVSRRDFKLVVLPGLGELGERLRRFDRVLKGDVAASVRDAGAASVAALLFGDAAALVASSRRVIVAADGAVAGAPFALLPVGPGASPLIEARELALAPSATLFAAIRSRSQGPSPHKLLALAGDRDAAGSALEGAAAEVRWLDRAFADVAVRSGDRARTVAASTADLGRYEVLHIAAHTSVDADNPWNSGVLLGEGSGPEAYLRAADISQRRLRTKLCVLSGCTSVGSIATAGEGVLGLSAAFMSAGVSSIVATLWPIEDRAAARFVERFYRELASGHTVAGALRETQNALRARPESRDPRAWAGFVLIGDPATTVTLKRNPFALPLRY